jgi:hypothetical protein
MLRFSTLFSCEFDIVRKIQVPDESKDDTFEDVTETEIVGEERDGILLITRRTVNFID